MAKITQKNNTEPATPSSGATVIYIDSTTKKLATKDDTGAVTSYDSGGGGGLPAGGTQGQILEKASATDGDAIWVAPSPSFQQKYAGFYSGYWYRTGTASTLALSQGANLFGGGFFRSSENIVINGLGVEPTASTTANYIIGIYEINETDPTIGTIAYQTPVQSLVAASGPQEVAATFTLLKNKLYVLGVISDAAVTWRTSQTSFSISIGSITPQDSTSSGERWGQSFAFGTLGDLTASSGITIRPPLVWFRKA